MNLTLDADSIDQTSNGTKSLVDLLTSVKSYSLFLLIIPVLTVFGNGLVILSVFRERSLQTVTNISFPKSKDSIHLKVPIYMGAKITSDNFFERASFF
jgi:hypothetical protein